MVTSRADKAAEGAERAPAPRLSAERCRALLLAASGGHLALSQGALPLVVPVTCLVDGEHLLVRAGLGLIGKVPAQPGVVAFQTEGHGEDGDAWWEVLVQGRAEVLDEHQPGEGAKLPPPIPLVDQSMTAALRISMELFTGRQYGAETEPQKEILDER